MIIRTATYRIRSGYVYYMCLYDIIQHYMTLSMELCFLSPSRPQLGPWLGFTSTAGHQHSSARLRSALACAGAGPRWGVLRWAALGLGCAGVLAEPRWRWHGLRWRWPGVGRRLPLRWRWRWLRWRRAALG